MTALSLYSDNEDFKNDLTGQINRFLADSVFTEEMPEITVVDENIQKCRQIREANANMPIILLTSSADNADDRLNIIIKKPFKLRQLIDVLQTANNKLDNSVAGYLSFNDYELRPATKEIADLVSGKVIKLTEKEVGIIKYLYKCADRFVGKNELQKDVWNYNGEVTTHTIETHIYRLRQKVENNTHRRLIITDSGGYKLNTGV